MRAHAEGDISVRLATSRDRDLIVEFNRALAEETEDTSLDLDRLRTGVARFLSEASLGRYYIAELGSDAEDGRTEGRGVGQIMITYEFSDWRNGPIWWIQSVFVAPDQRRRGVYGALHAHVRSAAREAGAVGLRLYVEKRNVAAQSTYRALGLGESRYLMYEDLWA